MHMNCLGRKIKPSETKAGFKFMKRNIFIPVSFLLFAIAVFSTNAATINIGTNGCELKDAIRSANADAPRGNCTAGSGADTIIAPNEWVVTINGTLPTITSDITFQSANANGVFYISGDNIHKIMEVTGNNTNVHFNRVHLINAKSNFFNGPGATLYVFDANIYLTDSLIGSSYIADASGAAIAIYDGTLLLERSTIIANEIESTGAPGVWQPSVIYAVDSAVEVIDSTFKHNTNSSIYMRGGDLNISGSLFNELLNGVAGKSVQAHIANSTFTASPSEYQYLSLFFDDSSFVRLNHNTILSKMTINNSILSVSNSLYPQCFLNNTNIVLNTHNARVYGGGGAPPFDCLPNNFRVAGLSALRDNGGPTETRALGYSSASVNGGDSLYCLPEDQRGINRIGTCDIGAYEVNDVADIAAQIVFSHPAPYVSAQELVAYMQVTNKGPGNASAIEVDLQTDHVFIQAVDSVQCTAFPCTIDYLGAGQQAYIPVDVVTGNHLSSPMSLTLEARATPASTHEDPDEGTVNENNLVTYSLPIYEGADLGINLDLMTPAPYFIGQTINYQATISNAGQSTADQVQFNLQGFGLSTITYNGCNSTVGQNCVINTLSNGGSKDINISAEVTQSQFDAIGTVSSNQVDINMEDNLDDQLNNGAISNADIKVTMELLQPAPHYSFQFMQFEITVTAINDASNIQLWTEFPGADFISIGICPSIPCLLPDLNAGDSVQTTFQVFAPLADPGNVDTFIHRVFATPGQHDPNLSDNEVTISRPLVAASDTSVRLDLISNPPFYVGQEVEYELTIYNTGPNDVTGVHVVDTPENLTLLWAAGQACQNLDCVINEIDLFQNENMTLMYRINQVGDFDLAINAQANEIDELPNNNTDSSNNGGTATLLPNDLIFKDTFE